MTAADNISQFVPSQPKIRIETITPELAQEYLGCNTHNRNVRVNKVKAYAEDMRSGNWMQNGDSIRFSNSGTLLDGQHRLMAVIEAQIPIVMLVVRGLPLESQVTIDTGAHRKFSDYLTLENVRNAAVVASATRSVLLWERGSRRFGGGGSNSAVTNPQLKDCWERNQEWLEYAAPRIQRVLHAVRLPSTVTGALTWAFDHIDAGDSEFFWDRLVSDELHEAGSPIFALRRLLLAGSEDKRRGSRNLTYLAAVTAKAWNKYRDGDSCEILKFSIGGASPERFPEPK